MTQNVENTVRCEHLRASLSDAVRQAFKKMSGRSK